MLINSFLPVTFPVISNIDFYLRKRYKAEDNFVFKNRNIINKGII